MGRIKRLLGRRAPSSALYDELPFLEAYRADTDERVAADPRGAVGGLWEEIGRLQYDYLRRNGLTPTDRMLDIGCGTLRGGRWFIEYLDPGRYTGVDISAAAIHAATELVEREGLVGKQPRLLVNESMRLTFDEVGDATYDVLLAQSVFTHLPPEEIEFCFENVDRVMRPGARFFFTYQRAPEHARTALKDFSHPWEFFERLLGDRVVERDDYDHPRGQTMAVYAKPR